MPIFCAYNNAVLKKPWFFLVLLAGVILLPWGGSVWLDVQAAERLQGRGEFARAAERAAAAARRWPFAPSLWVEAARAWAAAGDRARADEAYARAAEAGLLQPADWAQWGRLHWQAGDPDAALDIWRRAQHEGAASAEVLSLLAQAYALRGEAQNEQQTLMAWLAADETAAWAHYRLATWQAAALDEAALSHLRRAADLDPAYAPFADPLRLALHTALQEGNPLPVGQALAAQRAWPQAAAAFSLAVDRRPRDGLAWAWLAEARQWLGEDPTEALAQALTWGQQEADVWGLRGLYFSRQENWPAAREAWAQAVALNPERPDWWPSLGNARAQTGDISGALAAYRRAAQLAPEDARSWYLLGLFCLEYNIALDGEGLNAALKAFLLETEDPRHALLVGRYYLTLGQEESAYKYLRTAYERAPQDAQTALYWGIWQAQYGQPQAARAALETALQAPQERVRRQAQYWLETLP